MTTRRRTDLLVVHVTATPPSLDIGAREVDAMHRQRGFAMIGYHFVIRRDGRIEPGRPLTQVGAHVAGWNSCSVGVSMVGGVDARGRPENNMTPAQFAALERQLRWLLTKYPKARVCGHRDLSPDADHDGVIEPQEYIKACPCFDAIPWAISKGLPGAKIHGAWDEARPVRRPPGPDARIVYLQRLLSRAGYQFGAIDGIAGPLTRKAIKQFQLWAGLPQTGQFDEITVARLRARFEKAAA